MIDEGEFQAQLDRLERAGRRLHSPLTTLLQPGLTDERIGELMEPTGLTLPDELRVWWSWHSSVSPPGPDPDEGREISAGGWLHLPLQQAVDLYTHRCGFSSDVLASGSVEEANLTWRPGLFPFSHAVCRPNNVLAAITTVPEHAPAPVLMRTFMGIEPERGTGSESEVLGCWVELLESGRYTIVDGFWQTDPPGLIEQEARLRWLL